MTACTLPQLQLVSHFQGVALGSFARTFTFVNVSRRTSTVSVVPPGSHSELSVRMRMPNCRSGHEISPVIAGRIDRDSWSTTYPPP